MEFKKFYFEGNLYWGHINNPEDLKELLDTYPYDLLRKAQRLHDSADYEVPQFGFYAEYNDTYTLGDWIDENNLEPLFK